MKNWTVEKKDSIESMLINMFASIGMDIPANYEDIVQYCYEDVCETADPENWHSGDVAIAFRRWIESNVHKEFVQPVSIADKLREHIKEIGEEAFRKEWEEFDKEWTAEHGEEIEPNKPYFEIISEGYNEEAEREEIQIHAGENGNVFLIKTDEGFIVDVYNQDNHLDTLSIWEEDLMSDEEDSDADIVFDFSYPNVKAFIEKWGKTEEDVYVELELDEKNITEIGDTYFWEETAHLWIPKIHPEYNEEEQAIADYLQQPVM